MKKVLLTVVVVYSTLVLSSCAVGVTGGLYTKVKGPVAATSNNVGTKVGQSSAIGVLSLVGVGDAGINKAAKKGGITKISHVDYEVFSVLGLFTKVKTYVYGE